MSPAFKNMKNTLPQRQPSLTLNIKHQDLTDLSPSAGITTQVLIGFLLYCAVFFALLPIHQSKFRRLVWPAACGIAIVFFGIFGWAIHTNDGSPGNLLTPKVKLSPTQKSFAMLYAISTTGGSGTAYATRMSDWTRFSKTENSFVIPSIVSPAFGILTALLGVLATNAVHSKDNVIEWNPLSLLLYLQGSQYSAGCRAATFFAGLALFCSLIMVSS